MTADVSLAFEACWSAMLQGESLDAVLSRYPDVGDQLRPLLIAALAAHDAWPSEPAPELAAARSRTRMLRHASTVRSANVAGRSARAWRRFAVAGAALFLLFMFSGAGLIAASAQSLPGDRLYAFKLAAEQAQLTLSRSPETQISLLSTFDQRRVDEVKRLLVIGRSAKVQFEGHLDSVSGDLYTISGVPVLASPSTDITPDLTPGDYVRVAGTTQADGWVLAVRIQVAGTGFEGVVETMGPGSWTVSGRSFRLSPDVRIESGIALGDRVHVQVHTESGLTSAVSIYLLGRGAGASPVPLSSPALPTPTPPAENHSPETDPTAASHDEQETETPGDETPEPEDQTSLTFSGEVENQSQANWSVDGRQVAITSNTEIEGDIQVGDRVEVNALQAADGTLTAVQIKRAESGGDTEEDGSEDHSGSEFEFSGRVESISSSRWIIDGRVVAIDSQTEINGSPEVGDQVKVKVFTKSDGSLQAVKIEKGDSQSEEGATATPEHDD
jgi:hypothetical protein